MFLQNKLNQTASIFRDAQTRSLSQRSVRIKNSFQNMKAQLQKSWKPLEMEFMLHNQKMEIKTGNGTSLTTEALLKRQN